MGDCFQSTFSEEVKQEFEVQMAQARKLANEDKEPALKSLILAGDSHGRVQVIAHGLYPVANLDLGSEILGPSLTKFMEEEIRDNRAPSFSSLIDENPSQEINLLSLDCGTNCNRLVSVSECTLPNGLTVQTVGSCNIDALRDRYLSGALMDRLLGNLVMISWQLKFVETRVGFIKSQWKGFFDSFCLIFKVLRDSYSDIKQVQGVTDDWALNPVTTDMLNFISGAQDMYHPRKCFSGFVVKELTNTKILKSCDDKC